MKEQEYWAIKSPSGGIDALSIHLTQEAAWVTFLESPYKYSQTIEIVEMHKKEGYRAVKVRIEEVGE
jgi:hypothetical protein